MKLFHITKKKNLKSILKLGLLPEYTQGIRGDLTWALKKPTNQIWLTDDIAVPIKQAGDTFNETDWVVLEIDTEMLNVMPHRRMCWESNKVVDSPNEFVALDVIPKEKIKVVELSTTNF
jgi:ribosomal protein L21E